MEPLFLAAICGCEAGLFRDALHEVYIPRIQRGNDSFAAKILCARGALLSVLAHFFEDARWGSPVQIGAEGQSLNEEDQLFILTQAALYLTATRGYSAPEVRICYERAEYLCHSLDRPLLLYLSLVGQWRYSLVTDKLSATMRIAERVYALAQEQNDSALVIGAYRALTVPLHFSGDFETSGQYAVRGVELWRSRGVKSPVEELHAAAVSCLCFEALSKWHIEKNALCQATMTEAISLAIQDGIEGWRETGAMLVMTYWLALKAEAFYLADCISEALEAIREAEALVERSEERWWCAELYRLRGVFLTAIDGEEAQIVASFREAIRTAREQKSLFLEKRAEATYAEYRRQKASALGGHGFRLPL
jgi:hypothetical protein